MTEAVRNTAPTTFAPTEPAPTGPPPLDLANPGFEDGTLGWTFTTGAGVATNNPHSGIHHAYLDAGPGRALTQTVTAAAPGTYEASAWIATGAGGATFSLSRNDILIETFPLSSAQPYTRHTLPAITVNAGDRLTIAVQSGDGWTNIDDIAINALPFAPLLMTNPGFEEGTHGWTFTAHAGIGTNNPHTGTRHAYLDATPGTQVSQTMTATGPCRVMASIWTAAGNDGGTLQASTDNTAPASTPLPGRARYTRSTTPAVAVAAGDRLTVALTNAHAWVNADDAMLSPAAPADPVVTSSNPTAAAMFAWAKTKANSWVHLAGTPGPVNADENHPTGTSTATYRPSFWAGYAHRSAYYMRDFAHQVPGALLLGLHTETLTMLRSFARSATSERGWYPVWSMNFDTTTAHAIDYRGTDSFVRELPAPFELVERAAHAYRWTGDRTWITDETLWAFYRHTTDDFLRSHGTAKNDRVTIARAPGQDIFRGVASYDEGGQPLAEAGDAIASQYQAHLAVSVLAQARGDTTLADHAAQEARDLKDYFNTTWAGSGHGHDMIRAYSTSGQALTGWGRENSWFMPMKDITAPGQRTTDYLNFIHQQVGDPNTRPHNIEALTYLPDTFFPHGHNDRAWQWMQRIYDARNDDHPVPRQGTNGEYPEVSYTLIHQTIEGLLGITPDAPGNAFATHSHLPAGIDWLQAAHIPLGPDSITVRHDGHTSSTATNHSATRAYKWQPHFDGTHPTITVNGHTAPAEHATVHGRPCTRTTVVLSASAGATATVN